MRSSEQATRHFNLGGKHKIAGRLDAAEAEFRAALALDPGRAETRYALGIVLLGQGRFLEGFQLFESRHEVPQFNNRKPKIPFPEWDGKIVPGQRIVIWPEQGFGDQIQAARFAPIIKKMGADVTLICSPNLERLFSQLGVRIISASGEIEFPDPDAWVMCSSIAGKLGYDTKTLPGDPYLNISPCTQEAKPRIGLATHGNPAHANDTHRSLSNIDASVLRDTSIEVVSLHPEDTGARDFQDTAEIISGLDLVISVDTSVAHLSGAMGKECWVLIPRHNTDWRWMEERTDSPWYSSLRLFRQNTPGYWTEIIHGIKNLLNIRYNM